MRTLILSDLHLGSGQLGLDGAQLVHQLRILLHEQNVGRAAGRRLEAQGACTGESIHAAPAREVLAESKVRGTAAA